MKNFLLCLLVSLYSLNTYSQSISFNNGRGVARSLQIQSKNVSNPILYANKSLSDAKSGLIYKGSFDLENGTKIYVESVKLPYTIDSSYITWEINYRYKNDYYYDLYSAYHYSNPFPYLYYLNPDTIWKDSYNYRPISFIKTPYSGPSHYVSKTKTEALDTTKVTYTSVAVKFAYQGQNGYGQTWIDYLEFYPNATKIEKANMRKFDKSIELYVNNKILDDSVLVHQKFKVDSIDEYNTYLKKQEGFRLRFIADSIEYRGKYLNDSINWRNEIYSKFKPIRSPILIATTRPKKTYGEISLMMLLPLSTTESIISVPFDFTLCFKLSKTIEICPTYGIKLRRKQYFQDPIEINGIVVYNTTVTGGNSSYYGGKLRINFKNTYNLASKSLDIGVLFSENKSIFFENKYPMSVYMETTTITKIVSFPITYSIGGKRCKFTSGVVLGDNFGFILGLTLKLCKKETL